MKALNYAPRDKDLNLIALYWFLKNGKYLLARKALLTLQKHHPETPETVYAITLFVHTWSNIDKSTLKEIVVKKVNETLDEFTSKDLETFFTAGTSGSLDSLALQVRGLKDIFGKQELAPGHIQGITTALAPLTNTWKQAKKLYDVYPSAQLKSLFASRFPKAKIFK